METIYSVGPDDLSRFDATGAVDIFRKLLRAEAWSSGIHTMGINIQVDINAIDGGIDGTVEGAPFESIQGLIKQGKTCYQIKSGKFSGNSQVDIDSILFKKGTKQLKERVRECFDEDNTLVVVLFSADIIDEVAAVQKFADSIIGAGYLYGDLNIEFVSRNKLMNLINPFPSLALEIKGISPMGFQSYESWQRNADVITPYHAGDDQTEQILGIRKRLLSSDEAVHIQIRGEPGIGKSRLAFEIVGHEDLKPFAIYARGESFIDSDLMGHILSTDSNMSAVIVLDECITRMASYIWDRMKYRGSRIRLITITTEIRGYEETSETVDVSPLPDELVSEIIQDYGAPQDEAKRISKICSGSPRAAQIVGRNWQINPDDLLGSIDASYLWGRYIEGYGNLDPQTVELRRIVLMHIALFERVGFGPSHIDEAKAVASMAEAVDPRITWLRFVNIVQGLRQDKILQGENTLYITPIALHIKLWTDWWNTYGIHFDINDFVDGLPPKLLDWFFEMFIYGRQSDIAIEQVRTLLGDDGPFGDGSILKTVFGARFFMALTEADPEAALTRLQRTIGSWTQEDLLEFETGRREVVWALERIVVWRQHFRDAALLLLQLGEAENETWSNSASGVFAGLFTHGYGPVSPTEATPEERYPILSETIHSGSSRQVELVLKACEMALETRHFSRFSGPEFQGLRPVPELWTPKDTQEIIDSYSRVWKLIVNRLPSLEGDQLVQATKILISASRGVARIGDLRELVIDTLRDISISNQENKDAVLAQVVSILHYEGKVMPEEDRLAWEALKNDLTGEDFHSQIERYVRMDLFEDKFDKDGNQIDQARPHIQKLALQVFEEPSLLDDELEWLVTSKAERGFPFGYELGRRDSEFLLLPVLIQALEEATHDPSAFTLSGYFHALYELDVELWETELDSLAAKERLAAWIPEITWRSGMSDRAALRVLQLVQNGTADFRLLRMFALGRTSEKISQEIFDAWVEYLLNNPDPSGALAALELFFSYYIHGEKKREFPEELSARLLVHPAFLQPVDDPSGQRMDIYEWKTVTEAFLREYPNNVLGIARFVVEHFGERGTIFDGFSIQAKEVLILILRQRPAEVWQIITDYLGPPIDTRAFHLTHLLRGGTLFEEEESPLQHVPPEEIFKWVNENIEERAWYLASFVQPIFGGGEGTTSLAREILVRYGDREDVRNNLMANFSTEGWTGNESEHIRKKIEALLRTRDSETNQNVISWIVDYVRRLEDQMKKALDREEREDW